MSEILIVDDSLTVRMDLADAVEAAGFVAVPCATLAEARTALRTREIALGVLDVRLPDGDGVEFLEELRAAPAFAELPIVMLSTEAEVKDRVRGLKTGASDYVGKPYDTQSVIARIRQLTATTDTTEGPLVLVIDDSTTFREALASTLHDAGYRTMVAPSGRDGLRVAGIERPAAIVVDGLMPEMDGATVVRRIRLDPALRATPCLLLTGSEDEAAEVRALEAGADAFVRKDEDIDVVLARLAAMMRSAPAQRADASSLAEPKRILVVDDSITYLNALGDQLRDDGFDAVLATSGEEALELLAVQQVDCILLDRVMPGLSGTETCARIKAATVIRDIPLVMLTAHESRDAMIDGLDAGADDFISKSSGFDVLRARVLAQIRRKQIEDEHRAVRERLLRSELEVVEARSARQLAETRAAMAEQLARANQELQIANRELEAFSYSVSHDLRAPLRSIRSFTDALAEDLEAKLDDRSRDHLRRVHNATVRMGDLIDALLQLSRMSRAAVDRVPIDVTAKVGSIGEELQRRDPQRVVEFVVQPGMTASGDRRLLRVLFDNLIGNAWKFTSHMPSARIEVGSRRDGGDTVFFVRDNGAGFDPAKADRLFAAFQRLHSDTEFAGTGIGLATARRIVECHGGRIWADSAVGAGATFSFTLG
jgi:DNA-binding response OmpR family regulator